MKNVRYMLEYAGLRVLLFLFRLFPARKASDLGGLIGRTLGPRLAASRKAYRNLEMALPGLSTHHKDTVIKDMWDNLGRVVAEYPHLEDIAKNHTEIVGFENIKKFVDQQQPIMFFGAHIANWEVASVALFKQYNICADITYRAPNNPWVDRYLYNVRAASGKLKAYSKSRQGGRDLIKAIKDRRNVAILIDQKYNEGIDVDFFNRPASTNPAFVSLAQKYNLPLIPANSERLPDGRFRFHIEPPLPVFEKDGHTPRPIEDVIADAHVILENHIVQNPGQWLWVHRRWKT